MLQFDSLKKSYGDRQILNIPDLQLSGGIYWLHGVNGSGKTTLLKMIAGLIPFEGDILFEGISLRSRPLIYRQKLGWAEAEPAYPAFISGRELVDFYRQVRKTKSADVDELIHIFGMSRHLDAVIGSYSSGMVRRLSLLLAFVGEPALILMDEPLATLDAEAIFQLPGLIETYRLKHGASFIFSSHQPVNANGWPADKNLLVKDQTLQLLS